MKIFTKSRQDLPTDIRWLTKDTKDAKIIIQLEDGNSDRT